MAPQEKVATASEFPAMPARWFRMAVLCVSVYHAVVAGLPWVVYFWGSQESAALIPGVVVGSAAYLTAAYFSLRAALLHHEGGHLREAQRLGYQASLGGSAWNPLRWMLEGLNVRVSPPHDPAGKRVWELDSRLIASAGYAASDEATSDPPPRGAALLVGVLLASLSLARVYSAPLWYQLAAAAGLSSAMVWWRRREVHGILRAFSIEEVSVRDPVSSMEYFAWNFWRLDRTRPFKRRDEALKHALRTILLEEASFGPETAVMEVGSGGGTLWRFLPPELHAPWIQTDIDLTALRYAQTHGRGRFFIQADARKLPFEAGRFDGLVGWTFLDGLLPEHLEPTLAELSRVLKPGGRFLHLQDFADYPGDDLFRHFNDFMQAYAVPAYCKFHADTFTLSYTKVAPNRAKEIARALRKEAHASPGMLGDMRRTLAALLLGGVTGSSFAHPARVFLDVLAHALKRHGFTTVRVGPNEGMDRFGAFHYLIATKPTS